MEQQQPVRRRYIGKQRPRPSEFVPVCQPLAAQQLVPVSPPLAAEPHQPKRKRTQTGTRVQFAGQRLSCSVSLRGALMARLQQERASRETWTGKQWERVVQQVAKEDWGAVNHGGYRTKKVRPSAVGKQRAVSDQGQVDHGIIISAVGEAKSAVGQDESSATGKEQREEGQVAHAASAVGEEHASEHDKDSVIAECGTPHALPSVLSAEPTTLKTQRLAGYTVLEFIANGSFGDVYKASKKSTGELFAVKVMTKCRKTAKLTTEQQRELSLMRGLSRKHDHVVNLLGWRETCFNVQLFMPLYDQTLRQYIRGHSVPLYAGSTIVKQLSSAVAYLHDCSILHRDIKPPHILVKRQPLAEAMAADPLTKVMDSLILLSFVAAKPFKVPPPKKASAAVALAAASLMARVAGASEVAVWEPQPDTCPACPAPAAASNLFWVLVAAISMMINVVLLWWHCRPRPPPPPPPGWYQPPPVAVAIATPAPVPRRLRSVATQSQCTYKRGMHPRFHGAFNFEGYVETHLH